ncbi:MAG: hypothetical protein OXT09_07610 [Myxococcales bacterium]|nr:hypothetical protein [Myxococcales bacterium]
MSEGGIGQVRQGALWVLIALLGAAVGRFGWVAITTVDEERPIRDRVPTLGVDEAKNILEKKKAGEADDDAPVVAEPVDEMVRVMVSVSYSGGPATVSINDQPMGEAAYVGEFACKVGEELRIRIDPKKGPPIEGVRACKAGFIVVAE